MPTLEEMAGSVTSAAGSAIDYIQESILYEVPDKSFLQSEYDFTYRTFPADLGNTYMGNYMVININVPVRLFGGAGTQRTGINAENFNSLLRDEYSTVDILRYNKSIENYSNGSGVGNDRALLSVPRYTRRIKESIALFMPEAAMLFTSRNQYSDIAMTPLVGGLVVGGVSSAVGTYSRAAEGAIDSVAGSFLNEGGAGNDALKAFGVPLNPTVEVLFSNTAQRQFIFNFLLGPRNEKESNTIKEIVKTLRYYAAPELGAMGLFWIPPAEFDIMFFHQGIENRHIPKISTCVLEQIDVNYAPQGPYATFSNGHPVGVMIQLAFKEIEVVHKLRVLQGF